MRIKSALRSPAAASVAAVHRLDVFGDPIPVGAGYVSKGPAQQVITQEYDRNSATGGAPRACDRRSARSSQRPAPFTAHSCQLVEQPVRAYGLHALLCGMGQQLLRKLGVDARWQTWTRVFVTSSSPFGQAQRRWLSDQDEVHRFRAVPSCLVASGWRWRR
jgi:hypothetical protein